MKYSRNNTWDKAIFEDVTQHNEYGVDDFSGLDVVIDIDGHSSRGFTKGTTIIAFNLGRNA